MVYILLLFARRKNRVKEKTARTNPDLPPPLGGKFSSPTHLVRLTPTCRGGSSPAEPLYLQLLLFSSFLRYSPLIPPRRSPRVSCKLAAVYRVHRALRVYGVSCRLTPGKPPGRRWPSGWEGAKSAGEKERETPPIRSIHIFSVRRPGRYREYLGCCFANESVAGNALFGRERMIVS